MPSSKKHGKREHRFLGREHVLFRLVSGQDCIAGRVQVDAGVADAVQHRLLAIINLREELLRRREREQAPTRIGERVAPEVSAELHAAIVYAAGGQRRAPSAAHLISPAGPSPHRLGVEEPGSFVERPLASESVTER